MTDVTRESEPAGFVINGESYEVPTLDTITLAEERVLYVYADCVVQDFLPAHPDWTEDDKVAHIAEVLSKVRNPAFKTALAHIAYKRRHPEVSDADIQESLGSLNALEVDIALLRGDVEDPPQDSQKPPEPTTKQSELEKPTDSGRPSESYSDPRVVNLRPTGTSELHTSQESSELAPAS